MVRGKDPGLAAVISIIAPGLGQIYNEQFVKGIIVFVAMIVSVLLIGAGIGLLLAPLVFGYAVYDAYKTAK